MPQLAATPPRIAMRRINKRIGHHPILVDVSLEIAAGEIHVLVGANGAGKSTLIRILSGADCAYSGEIALDGRLLALGGPREGRRAGIQVIYQELSLVNCLSAVDNWVLTEERRLFSWLSREQARRQVREQCARLGLAFDVEIPIERLTLGDRQLLEIARALSAEARVLVLDEPTSALSESEASRLLTLLKNLAAQGTAILYVSHRTEEIYQIADRISVLRDGQHVVTRQPGDLPAAELVIAMVGDASGSTKTQERPRELAPVVPRELATEAPAIRVQALNTTCTAALRDVTFEVAPGEILGVCGLRGSGAQELLEVLGGARPRSSGTITRGRIELALTDPRAALASGIAYLPADRKASIFPALSLLHNGAMSSLSRYSRFGFVERRRCRTEVSRMAEVLTLGQCGLDDLAGALSGGNQQKLALLRCLLADPKVLLMSEPTRGVDIAAKEMLYAWIRKAATEGLTIILQSSELDELVALCRRVLVLRQGRLMCACEGADLSRRTLLASMMGGDS